MLAVRAAAGCGDELQGIVVKKRCDCWCGCTGPAVRLCDGGNAMRCSIAVPAGQRHCCGAAAAAAAAPCTVAVNRSAAAAVP